MHFVESGISKSGGAMPSIVNIEHDPSKVQLLARHLVKVKGMMMGGREGREGEHILIALGQWRPHSFLEVATATIRPWLFHQHLNLDKWPGM
jgi:hypothetical protein